MARSGAKMLLPTAGRVSGGAHVGDTTSGTPRRIHFPDDLLRRHHLYIARTRMGKSTLMHHLISHKMREKAAGRDGDAIIVVDPHADLVNGLLEQVPESLVSRVKLIDLADERGAPGINLLDTRIFSDRDRTADSVVRVAKGLWDQWGPRMQSILEFTVKTLHEANKQMDPDEQYTILDGLRILSNPVFRTTVLDKVEDPYILEWWANTFYGWSRDYKADSLAPVQTRLSYYASSVRARAILGQPRSTIDLRETILDGGILLVSTSQGVVGRDVAALVGASLLNLVDSVIREQGRMPLEQRRGALVVVDEMQSMPGVDYESMLSELGKFGASFVLATQSLAKLDDLSPTMRDTLLANVGCLAVFQVAGSDARQLVWELGKDRISEEDMVSLPVHHCYVRATVEKERLPTFSMMARKPDEGDPEMAARIRAAALGYLVTAGEISERESGLRSLAEKYRREMKQLVSRRTRRRRSNRRIQTAGRCEPSVTRTLEHSLQGQLQRSVRSEGPGWPDDGASCPDALPRPAGGGGYLRLVQGSRLQVRGKADGIKSRGISTPRHGTHTPDAQVPPHRKGVAPSGPRRRQGHGRPAPQPSRLHPLAAGAAGPVRRPGRHLPGGLRRVQRGPSHRLPVVSGHAFGRGNRPSRRKDRRYPAARTHLRQGGLTKRVWRLTRIPLPGTILMLMPDEIRLRYARRMLALTPVSALLALERAAVGATDHSVWQMPSVSGAVDLGAPWTGCPRAAPLQQRSPSLASPFHGT